MAHFEDGWIDRRNSQLILQPPQHERDAETVRKEVEGFRGQVLSRAYCLERLLDTVIIWHLFLDRQDGMALFFEENILQDLGLERKIKLVHRIANYWSPEDIDILLLRTRVTRSKSYRDRVAHWPTRLEPLTTKNGEVLDYIVYLEKGNVSELLDSKAMSEWLAEMDAACSDMKALITLVRSIARSNLFEE